MCMIRLVFFGCGIIDLSVKQEADLKKIYKISIAKRLELGEKFSRYLLYIWRLALGVELVKLGMYVAMAALRL